MARLILVIGEPGTGKSTACENLDEKSTFIIKPNNKPLPFKGWKKRYNEEAKNTAVVKTFSELEKYMYNINEKAPHVKTVVVEDITHYFNYRVMADSKVKGFEKWSALAVDTFNALLKYETDFREDLTIILIGHVQESMDSDGVRKMTMYTPGKLLDNQIKIPSYVTYMFHATVRKSPEGVEYKFLTNQDGSNKECKTPKGCFEELYIDNDYAAIVAEIDKYENE